MDRGCILVLVLGVLSTVANGFSSEVRNSPRQRQRQRQQASSWTTTAPWIVSRSGLRSAIHDDTNGDAHNESDTLETLSAKLTVLLSKNTDQNKTDRQKELLTTRLADICINRTFVNGSTIPNAGKGLFAAEDCPKGTLLTCYPGDALVVEESDNDAPPSIQWGSRCTNGTKTISQEYMLRAVRDDWGIVALTNLGNDDDDDSSSYIGHFANDGARGVPTSESELAAYTLESSEAANAMHVECEGCHMVTLATRDIAKGDEIFVTYGPEYWSEQSIFVVDDKNNDDDDEYYVYEYDFDDDFEDDFDDFEPEDDYCDDATTESILDGIATDEESSESSTRGMGFG